MTRKAIIHPLTYCSCWLALATLTACGGTEPPFTPNPNEKPYSEGPVARSDKLRNLTPSAADVKSLVDGNTAFACDLYGQIRGGQDNFFVSPHSISAALVMTYAGARGQTETEMAQALHFTLPQARLHPAFNAIDLALQSRGQGSQGKDGQGFRLNIANALWGQVGYPFLMGFLDELALNYGAGMRLVDFVQSPDPSRQVINDWVAHETEGEITDLLGENSITKLTRLVLTNAIYFNAAWKEQFPPAMTHSGVFHLLDGSTRTVQMMETQADDVYNHVQGNGWEAMELLYDGDELSMVVILPDSGRFADFEARLDAQLVEGILNGLAPTSRSISMPHWNIRSRYDLGDILAAMGMPLAFSSDADFSGMTGNRDLSIARVIHEAFVSVDEAGTEAGASTAVVIELGIPDAVVVDRPFIFLIRDIQTNAILFVGRVIDPTA